MAEAIGIGSGILAFLTVSVQLTAVLCSVWDDFKEAPEEIQNIAHRIKQLNFYLQEVQKEEQKLNAAGATCQSTSELGSIWASLHVKLRTDTTEFQALGERLKRDNDTKGKFRVRAEWVIKNKKRTLEFDRKVTGYLETFKTIWGLITNANVKQLEVLQHQHFDDMSQTLAAQSDQIKGLDLSQNALHMESHVYLRSIETLTRRSTATIEDTLISAVATSQRQAEILGSKMDSLGHQIQLESSSFVTKESFSAELARIQGQITQVVRGIAPSSSEPIYTTVSTTQTIVRKSVSVCFNSWNSYRLPIGHLQVFTGSKKEQNNSETEGASGHGLGVQFEFFPAPWLSSKSIVASFQYYHNRSTPIYRPNMYYSATVSSLHQAFRAVEDDDVALLRRLLSSNLANPNDRDKDGWTLLHKAARWRQPEICSLLINEGADLNATDIWGRTPLHVACEFGVSQTARLLTKHAGDLSDPVISSAMRSYATVPSIFNHAINSIFFRLFEDFTGFEDMAPTVTATILCFQLSGTFKLQPKALRSWLLSRRPKHLDSAMPTQGLISDELRTMFSGFSGTQMRSMDTAVRHSCAVKSPDLFLLLSDCRVVSNLPKHEVLFSLGIASENGNLTPLKALMPIKASLQKTPGTEDRLLYQGHIELVKSVLDERTFGKASSKATSVTSTNSGYKTTPLMFAAINGDVNVLRYLIMAGGDVQAVDWRGRTALDHAMASNNDGSEAIIELLQVAQREAELRGPRVLDTSHMLSDGASEDAEVWASVVQICGILLEWWQYLRQFTWSDVFLVFSGLVVVTLGFVGLVVPGVVGFLWRHRVNIRQWSIYFVVAYSMYRAGNYRGQV